jgi:hypothetical protein
MERAPYAPKTNGNLIRCHIQIFGKNSGGFEKVDPGVENRIAHGFRHPGQFFGNLPDCHKKLVDDIL